MLSGFRYLPDYFTRAQQEALVGDIRDILDAAPLFTPRMPRTGKEMSVRMSNAGPLGWLTDKEGGYRYQATHPVTNRPWPPIPRLLMALWDEVTGKAPPPEACLINWYGPEAKMGLHVDADEEAMEVPVVSVSLGDSALFRVGSTTRGGKTQGLKLHSGDVVVLGGEARRAYHGITRIYAGTSSVLDVPGRINLTLRRVTPAAGDWRAGAIGASQTP